ncbi:condensation domain-containing protein [Actinomadura gamaensis]|uniref:Condensation domain-containing protein n=1 Tax=Actinomadura gamaensis TaxID=1763541 RepID=A0ABV9TVY7_9ACTN
MTAGVTLVPIAPIQNRLWFLDRLTPGTAQYNVCVGYELAGPLDQRALRTALTEVVARHDALRTNYLTVRGRPYAVVRPVVGEVPLPVVRLGPDAERKARAIAAAQAGTPFDLAGEPLLRAHLLAFDATRHVLVLTFHHIAVDDWSLGIVLAELGEIYAASRAGRPLPADPPAPGYAEFAAWQRRALSPGRVAEETAYWQDVLAGASMELPTDRPRGVTASARGGEAPFAVPEPVAAALTALARSDRATPFMVALTALAVLLRGRTGSPDVIVGVPVAGRPGPEFAATVGFFVNTVPVRIDLSAARTFRSALAVVRRALIDALDHSLVPFDRLVAGLGRESGTLVRVACQLLDDQPGPGELRWHDLDVAAWDGVTASAVRTELELHLLRGPGRLHGLACYSTDLFDAATIDLLVAGYLDALASGVNAPDDPLPELPELREPDPAAGDAAGEAGKPPSAPVIVDMRTRRAGKEPS